MVARIIIAGRYQISDPARNLLGRGGMGEVYRASDTQTGETVAVKLLDPQAVSRDPAMLERFRREGEALQRLDHPNIVRLLAAVEEGGQHCLVMEYIPGGSLEDLLKLQGKLPHDQIELIALDLADALTRAHRLGILHRDLKPANVLLAADGSPRLADFGISFLDTSPTLTQSGMLIGTIDYLSPEACRGERLDERADIWSFGVLLFELLSGQRPFQGENLTARLAAILSQPVPDLAVLAPDAPDALLDLVYRMLEKDRCQRIPSVRLVGAELEAIHKGWESRQGYPHSRFATPAPAAGKPRHNLPAQATPFVGREAELAQLDSLLSDPAVRLVTVVGVGGMGKTRLAIETGARQLESYPQGVYFASLAALKTVDTIDPTIAQALGVNFPAGELHHQLIDYLKGKRLLLVLDNFEHLLDGVGQVVDFVRQTEGVKLLVTSRTRLNLQVEHVFHLSGMEIPDWETVQDALEYSSVKLFLQCARRAQRDFQLDGSNMIEVAHICRLVGGMPLGILMAAAWLEMLNPKEIAAEISRSCDFLQSGLADLPERQRSLQAVFDYSWNQLNPHEQDVFTGLSVFRSGFTRQAAQAVTGASIIDLMALVNKSLIEREPAGRYTIHELLRQYAGEKLSASGKHAQISRAHLDYWKSELSMLTFKDSSRSGLEILNWLVMEVDNLRAALSASLALGDPRAGLDLLWNLRTHVRLAGRLFGYQDLRDWLVRLLEAVPQPCLERARGLIQLGHKIYALGDYPAAIAIFEEGLSIAESLGDPSTVAYAAFMLAWPVAGLGDFDRAQKLLVHSQELYQKMDDPVNLAFLMLVRGEIACAEGDLELARQLDEQSLILHRTLEDQQMLPTALANLAKVLIHFGEHDRAWKLLRECQVVGQNEPDQEMVMMIAAFLHHAEGRHERAACLLGFETAQRAAKQGLHIDIGDKPDYERNLAELRGVLGDQAFEAAWAEGQALTWDQAFDLALLENCRAAAHK